MASFLGITYNHDRDENFKEFLTELGITGEIAEAWVNSKPSPKLEKDGDTFIASTTDAFGESVVLKFTSGEEFDEELMPGIVAKTTFTVDDNVAVQVQKLPDDRSITFTREYSDKELLVTITLTAWDGAARRYYKAD